MAEQTCGVCGQGGYWVGYDSDVKGDRCINHTGVASETKQ